MKKFLRKFRERGAQDGITILLSVIMMSGISIITVTVAFFVMQEVRSSRGSYLTEPAIVAAETAGERGIYLAKRSQFTTSCNSAPYTRLDGSTVTSGNNVIVRNCLADQPARLVLQAGHPFTVFFYDPDNINGNFCMETQCPGSTQLFETIRVSHVEGAFAVNADVSTLDLADITTGVIAPGTTEIFTIPSEIPSSEDERFTLTLEPTFGTATLEISTTGLYSGPPDFRTLDAEACVSNANITDCEDNAEVLKRRINITLPK